MKISIVEAQSPCFAILSHPNQEEVINYGLDILKNENFDFVRQNDFFMHCRLKFSDCRELINMSPMSLFKSGKKPYASIFSTRPGYYYRAHKDGTNIRWAINYILEVKDELCETSWYDDSVSNTYEKDMLHGFSRELNNFDKSYHKPICKTTLLQNQCVLFNTDIYHDFDNRKSTNWRHILTIRYSEPESFFWQDAYKIIKDNCK